jgi:hypothetical protein
MVLSKTLTALMHQIPTSQNALQNQSAVLVIVLAS